MVTKTWKKKIIFPLDHSKAMVPLTLGAINVWNRYFVWFQKTITSSFSLLVCWTFQLRKLVIDCAALKSLYDQLRFYNEVHDDHHIPVEDGASKSMGE
jgi:hypothetical protein